MLSEDVDLRREIAKKKIVKKGCIVIKCDLETSVDSVLIESLQNFYHEKSNGNRMTIKLLSKLFFNRG